MPTTHDDQGAKADPEHGYRGRFGDRCDIIIRNLGGYAARDGFVGRKGGATVNGGINRAVTGNVEIHCPGPLQIRKDSAAGYSARYRRQAGNACIITAESL